jgi:hypothetical protein
MALGSILADAALQILGALLEFPVRGLGCAFLRYCLRRRHVAWDSHAVQIVGILGWVVLLVLGYKLWYWSSAA